MEENVEELIREAVEAAGGIAEVDEGTEQELVSLAANPQPFPPPVLVEAPDQVQEFQASIAQVTTLFTTYNKVQTQHLGKPLSACHRLHLGIAQIAFTPPPRTQTGTQGHFFSGAILPFYHFYHFVYHFL